MSECARLPHACRVPTVLPHIGSTLAANVQHSPWSWPCPGLCSLLACAVYDRPLPVHLDALDVVRAAAKHSGHKLGAKQAPCRASTISPGAPTAPQRDQPTTSLRPGSVPRCALMPPPVPKDNVCPAVNQGMAQPADGGRRQPAPVGAPAAAQRAEAIAAWTGCLCRRQHDVCTFVDQLLEPLCAQRGKQAAT